MTAAPPRTMTLDMAVVREEDGRGYMGYIPSWRGCVTGGGTREQLRERMQEAASLFWTCIVEDGFMIEPAPDLGFPIEDHEPIVIAID